MATLQVKAKPRSSTSSLVQMSEGTWVARLKSPPVDGKANAELVGLVADHFVCRRSSVEIKAGTTGRTKFVKIEA